MTLTSRNDIFNNLATGNGSFICYNTTTVSGTAGSASTGFFNFGLATNVVGTTYPATLTGIPLPGTNIGQNRFRQVAGGFSLGASIRGLYLCRAYQIGTLNLAATGSQFTHDSATFPIVRTVMGVIAAPLNLIPFIFVTTATTNTAPSFTINYINQDGFSVSGTKAFTLPSASTIAGSGYILRLENGDSSVQDITSITVNTAGLAGTATIYGLRLIDYGNIQSGSIAYTSDSMYDGMTLSEVNPSTATSGTATSFLAVLAVGGSSSNPVGWSFATTEPGPPPKLGQLTTGSKMISGATVTNSHVGAAFLKSTSNVSSSGKLAYLAFSNVKANANVNPLAGVKWAGNAKIIEIATVYAHPPTKLLGNTLMPEVSSLVATPPLGFLVNARAAGTGPRLLDFSTVTSKAAAAQGTIIWQAVITQAQNANYSEDRMVCAAALYRQGTQYTLPSGFSYGMTPAQYGAQAVNDLLNNITLNPQSTNGAIAFPAFTYDWIYPLINGTSNQTTILAALKTTMDTRDNSTVGLWQWCGYNNKGGDGMVIALATHGDTTNDYVNDFWNNNWNSTATRGNAFGSDFWNWHWNRLEQTDCGSNEGYGYYYNNVESNFITKPTWESAVTGNAQNFLDIGWFNNWPLWFLFQQEPGFPVQAGSIAPNTPWALSTTNYEGSFTSTPDAYDMLASNTSGPNGALARWILDQLGGYTVRMGSTARRLIYGLLIGDPRVVGVSPTNLGLSKTFKKSTIGHVFVVGDNNWNTSTRVMFFGCNNWVMRSVSCGGISTYHNCPGVLYRGAIWDHTYETGDFGNQVVFYSGTQIAILPGEGATVNDPNTPGGTFTDNGDGTYESDSIPNYRVSSGSFNLNQITTCHRKVAPTSDLTSIVVTDTVVCSNTLTPHVVWNMATQPTISGQTVSWTGADGITSFSLSINQPLTITAIGGFSTGITLTGTTSWTHNSGTVTGVGTTFSSQVSIGQYLFGPDGQPYKVFAIPSNTSITLRRVFAGTTASGQTTTIAVQHFVDAYDGTTPPDIQINSDFPSYPYMDQLHLGGFWRIHVLMPAGGTTLTTTLLMP